MLTNFESILQWTIDNYEIVSISAITIVFGILSMRYFRNREERNQKSVVLLTIAVVLGALSVVPAVLLSLLMLIVVPVELGSVVVAPVAEEIAKGAFVGLIARTRLIRDKMDGFVYGAMVGTGFAVVENILYALVSYTEEGLYAGLFLASFRSIFIVIGHPLYTGLTGIGIGAFKEGETGSKYVTMWQGMLLHAIWNGTSLLGQDYWLQAFIGVIIMSVIILRIQVNRARN